MVIISVVLKNHRGSYIEKLSKMLRETSALNTQNSIKFFKEMAFTKLVIISMIIEVHTLKSSVKFFKETVLNYFKLCILKIE